MAENSTLWMVKESSGRVVGPLPTARVLELISELVLTGEEMVARHPNGEWISISKEPEFYDRLLAILSATSADAETEEPPPVPDSQENLPSKPEMDFQNLEVERESTLPTEKVERKESTPPPSQEQETLLQPDTPSKKTKKKGPTRDDVIELIDIKKHVRKIRKRKARPPLLLTAIILFVGVYILLSGDSEEEKLRLIAPRKGRPAIAKPEVDKQFQLAIAEFQKDTFINYRKAMNLLVPVAEGAPRHSAVHQLLCLTYRELWPFTYQDQKDEAVILEVSRTTESIDPGGVASTTCRLVTMMVKGKMNEARSLSESSLESYPTAAILYEIKGEVLAGQASGLTIVDAAAGISYMEKAEQLWPQWLKPKVSIAAYAEKIGDINKALQKLRETLQSNPNHDVARAFYGMIHFRKLNKVDVATEQLLSVVNNKQLPRALLAEVNLVLAQSYDKLADGANALKFAKRAYQLNPASRVAQNLVRKFGGDPSKISISEEYAGALHIADQFYMKSDYFAALAEYKAAFEVNPKNSLAALKAAKCHWKLNQFKDAMEWLDKAIAADPKSIEAYVTKAEYYTERFDFYAAEITLRKAQSVNKNNYEILRGYATLEVKRNNFPLAEAYALRALKIHDTDLQSHIILTKSYLAMQKYQEAYQTAAKLLELDENSIEAQATYTKVLASVQGVDAAIHYTKGMIENYPRILGYRLILADVFFQDERYADAEAMYRQVSQIESTKKEAFWGLGRSLQAQGKYQEAIDPLLKAAALDPGDANSSFYLGQLYMAAGQNEKAIRAFERVVNINPVFPLGHLYLGKVALAMGNFELALKEAEKEQMNNPNIPDGYILAADIYTQQKRYSNCTQELQKALKLNAAGAMIYVNMAKCYRLSGSFDSALSMLNVAQEKESGLPEVYLELGQGYEMKGDIPSAIESYNQYLTLAPNGKDSAFVRGRLQSLR